MYSDLIIGHDGSAAGRDALALARRLALATGARPLVVHVRPSALIPADTAMESQDEFWDSEVASVLDEARALLADVPGATFQGIPDTSPARALHRVAQDADAALIVLGATHRSGLGRVVPGTTADAVLHSAPCAVAIAPAGYADRPAARPLGLVVAAVDGGRESERVGRVAAAIARQAGAAVRLVSVVEPPYSAGPLYAGSRGYGSLSEIVDETFSAMLARVAKAAGDDVAIERRLLEGHIAEEVASAAAGADLLVVGSRGYGPLRRVVLGSATTKILQAVDVPVLVVPRRADEELDDVVAPLGAATLRSDAAGAAPGEPGERDPGASAGVA